MAYQTFTYENDWWEIGKDEVHSDLSLCLTAETDDGVVEKITFDGFNLGKRRDAPVWLSDAITSWVALNQSKLIDVFNERESTIFGDRADYRHDQVKSARLGS